MKKLLFLSLALFFVMSCSDDEDYENLNRDPNNPTQVSAESLYTAATKSLFDQMESTSVNSNIFRMCSQYWTETTYVDEANYDLLNRSIPDNFWSELYRDVLYDLADAKKNVETSEGSADGVNKIAQIELLSVYTWQVLVDTFGDIPYSQALKGQEYPSPLYDSAASIYTDLLARTDAALAMISSSATGFTGADVVYGGDMAKWTKFGNSLKLKLAMRLADANPSVASAAVAQAAPNVFTSNDDNFIMNYEGATPNTNPLWPALVQSGRNDFVLANTFVDELNTLEDPRRTAYMQENLGAGIYVGGTYGQQSAFGDYTHIGEELHDPTFRGVLLDYSEVQFNLAEAAEQGFSVSGSAEDHYNEAIMASMEDWGIDSGEAATYLASAAVAYSTASGDWREKIGKQYWIAMYNRGFEGWYAYRKFDTPEMNIPAVSQLPVPNRFTYPADEQTLNQANYDNASNSIGGDAQSTKLFWDKY